MNDLATSQSNVAAGAGAQASQVRIPLSVACSISDDALLGTHVDSTVNGQTVEAQSGSPKIGAAIADCGDARPAGAAALHDVMANWPPSEVRAASSPSLFFLVHQPGVSEYASSVAAPLRALMAGSMPNWSNRQLWWVRANGAVPREREPVGRCLLPDPERLTRSAAQTSTDNEWLQQVDFARRWNPCNTVVSVSAARLQVPCKLSLGGTALHRDAAQASQRPSRFMEHPGAMSPSGFATGGNPLLPVASASSEEPKSDRDVTALGFVSGPSTEQSRSETGYSWACDPTAEKPLLVILGEAASVLLLFPRRLAKVPIARGDCLVSPYRAVKRIADPFRQLQAA
ncbi:hypothetical protein BO71DRAFT_488665 [Aspergillus ellipticus CBS 707.79]|uniref:Uncharacterized protein n=1 Tax=Aspergillus ellipticus CBS 707.79 TaxID=1448320 RepID=A0A319CVP6_9EURO|nr:hypothetical protein BO71DRAFT_488665 [Aspergillus ellipticus CBS 707.79]